MEQPEAFSYNRKFNVSSIGGNCIRCEFNAACRGGCNEMSLMLTGKKHNDPYCFLAIEKKLFAKELKNPARKLLWSLRRRINSSDGEKLSARFSGLTHDASAL